MNVVRIIGRQLDELNRSAVIILPAGPLMENFTPAQLSILAAELRRLEMAA